MYAIGAELPEDDTMSRSSQRLVHGLGASSLMCQCHSGRYAQGHQEGWDLFCSSGAETASRLSLKPLKCGREGQHGKSLSGWMDLYPNTQIQMEL